MSINIGNYAFEGPFTNPASLSNASGVYSVLTRPAGNGTYSVVDIGESGSVRDRVMSHDRTPSWSRCVQSGGLCYAAYYCDERARMSIEKALRTAYNPPCGDR